MKRPQDDPQVRSAPETASRLYFGDFELDPETAELRLGGEIVPIRPLATRALLLLVRRAGRLTTRDELHQALWVDSYLDWNQALNQCIRQIRNVLGDCADRPVYLETVHHRGYRFIATVTSGASRSASAPTARPRRGNYRMFLAGMGASLALVALLMSICIRF
ncbi:MAG: winged helix-turn-helix domain-containing protein [Acidobacteria bacterium]|nr:winged helix-turn-helix domain-containing protein [Acidobacteriota bacterium]